MSRMEENRERPKRENLKTKTKHGNKNRVFEVVWGEARLQSISASPAGTKPAVVTRYINNYAKTLFICKTIKGIIPST